MLHLHSFLRWVILILLLVAVYRHFVSRHQAFTAGHRKTGLFLMITADLMHPQSPEAHCDRNQAESCGMGIQDSKTGHVQE